MIFLRNVVLFKICGKGVFHSTLKLLLLSTELIIFKNWEITVLTHSRPIFDLCTPKKQQKFSDIFKDYRSGTMAWCGLICHLLFPLWYILILRVRDLKLIFTTLYLSTLSRQSFMKKAYRSFKNLIKRLITFTSLLNWRVHVPMCLECLRASRVNVSFKLTCLRDNMPRNTCLFSLRDHMIISQHVLPA